MPQHLTNYSTGTRTYLYHPKEGGPKGANRLCTVLYHEIRRVKHGKHPARFARNLYLVADNAADNKNNDVIGFCCELVSRKWFDSVEFAFGEVGHTHNGEDAAHHVLNECVGRHVALTLGARGGVGGDAVPGALAVCAVPGDLPAASRDATAGPRRDAWGWAARP